MTSLSLLLVGLFGLGIGSILGYLARQSIAKRDYANIEAKIQKRITQAKEEVDQIISQAKEKQPSISISYRADIEAAINRAISEGLIKKIDARAGRVWIQELAWISIDSEVKEKMTRVIAAYCAIQKNTEYQSIDIMGWISGKKLASYTSFGGFKVY